MNLIYSETFQSLPKWQRQALMEESVGFYYPGQEDIILSNPTMRKDMEDTLKKVEEMERQDQIITEDTRIILEEIRLLNKKLNNIQVMLEELEERRWDPFPRLIKVMRIRRKLKKLRKKKLIK